MSVYNAGMQVSQWSGGHLYDRIGFGPLVLVSAVTTALAWLLVPLVRIDEVGRSRDGAPRSPDVRSVPA
jgi:predicted MFS family arabinose efflux permease